MDLADRQHQLYHIKGIWMIKKIVSTRHFMDRTETKKEAAASFFRAGDVSREKHPTDFIQLSYICLYIDRILLPKTGCISENKIYV